MLAQGIARSVGDARASAEGLTAVRVEDCYSTLPLVAGSPGRREAPGQATVSFSLLKVGTCPSAWALGRGELWLGSHRQHGKRFGGSSVPGTFTTVFPPGCPRPGGSSSSGATTPLRVTGAPPTLLLAPNLPRAPAAL